MTEIERLTAQYREQSWRADAEAAMDALARTRSEAKLEILTALAGWTREEYLEDFRRRTIAEVGRALESFGLPHPRLAFKAACDELHAMEAEEQALLEAHLRLVVLYSAAIEIHERRGGGKYDWPRADLSEAELWTGISEKAAVDRRDGLERRAAAKRRKLAGGAAA